jgi:hypothetical protein
VSAAAVPDRRRDAWRFIGGLMLRERRGITFAVLSGLAWQGAAILTPVIAAQAIDAMLAGDRSSVYLWAAGSRTSGTTSSATHFDSTRASTTASRPGS